jgi:hypothetical protein
MNFLNVAYHFGALIVMGAMGFFVTLGGSRWAAAVSRSSASPTPRPS